MSLYIYIYISFNHFELLSRRLTADSFVPDLYQIVSEIATFVFEHPNLASNIVRRLKRGVLVFASDRIFLEDGSCMLRLPDGYILERGLDSALSALKINAPQMIAAALSMTESEAESEAVSSSIKDETNAKDGVSTHDRDFLSVIRPFIANGGKFDVHSNMAGDFAAEPFAIVFTIPADVISASNSVTDEAHGKGLSSRSSSLRETPLSRHNRLLPQPADAVHASSTTEHSSSTEPSLAQSNMRFRVGKGSRINAFGIQFSADLNMDMDMNMSAYSQSRGLYTSSQGQLQSQSLSVSEKIKQLQRDLQEMVSISQQLQQKAQYSQQVLLHVSEGNASFVFA
jgi:hypothetical protein